VLREQVILHGFFYIFVFGQKVNVMKFHPRPEAEADQQARIADFNPRFTFD